MNNHRIQSIDLIKVIAMICVMGLHCAGAFVSNDSEDFWANVVGRISVCAIPLFFMVSGYLLFGRQISGYSYPLKKSINIIRFVAICTFFYTFLHWIFKGSVNLMELFKNFGGAFIGKGSFSIFWYFGAMILIYFFYPILNNIYRKNYKSFVGLFMALFFTEAFIYTINITHKTLTYSNLIIGGEMAIPQILRLWNWLFYFMLGGLCKRQLVEWLKRYSSIWVVIILCFINVWMQFLLLPALGNIACEYFYSSFFVISYSLMLFILFCSKHIENNKIIQELSKCFLPVYAFHPFIIRLLYKDIQHWGDIAPLFLWVTVSITTIVISFLVMKIPISKKIFRI